MVGGTGGVECDSAVVVAAAVAVLVKTLVKVYPAGQGLHISALTASGCDSGCLSDDFGESYTALAFSGVETDASVVL